MVLGWAAQCSALGGISLIRIGWTSVDWADWGGFMVVFVLMSGLVCGIAWLLVAMPVTFCLASSIHAGLLEPGVFGVMGASLGLLMGILPWVMDWGIAVAWGFGGLAAVAGGVCGIWTAAELVRKGGRA